MVSLLGFIGAGSTVDYEAPLPDTGTRRAWTDPVAVSPCRVEHRTERIQLPTGAVVVIAATVIMPAEPVIEVGGRVDLRDGNGPRPVHRVAAPVWLDETRMHHEVGVA
ncbi:hypothetical protein [Actinokineospora globicatena]|uniref:Uncharacterized protein n=1 Tax=Actinokineospora globicatena TaxID=103729 RepID=A0A9W6VAA4_9PSEU|nr:hypothetical protein [Actinokineospora globicatena]GLW91773.1 hypothetical protein Aglo03_25890 [Actinokineospora globicatena]